MKSLLAAVLVVVSVQAQAVFVVNGDAVLDTDTGLSWLNLDREQPGDFRPATAEEVSQLFAHAKLSADTFGEAFNGSFYANDLGAESFWGFIVPPPPFLLSDGPIGTWHMLKTVFLGWAPSPVPGEYTTFTFSQFLSDDYKPWLVQDAPLAPVPEPSTWLLMLAGLYFCLQRARAARQS